MEYNFALIESKWKKYWKDQKIYKVCNNNTVPKYYVLDMFPYPSGSGLHVGHPLGYIASDIYARFKKMQGYNVLHPMGFDAFGLPAEQYAIDTGQHPAVTTAKNIARYKEQLDNIGFNYDWDREIQTSDPKYYKWTQWIFTKLFHSWYHPGLQKAQPIEDLIKIFEEEGNVNFPNKNISTFTADTWSAYSEEEKRNILMHYRLAYLGYAQVWWCEALSTVLANDEVVNGVSERGGHPVEKRKMRQWFLRITTYADRLLNSLDDLNWSDAMKEMQRNWIGKSEGALVTFALPNNKTKISVFTTRPDTIFGVDFLVLAPEHESVAAITTQEQSDAVSTYTTYVKSRSERERMTEKKISGCFTGSYAIHPFTKKEIPIWISEYVLAGYGTGAIMAVPAGDERDFAFARHFDLPITNIFGSYFNNEEAYSAKDAIIENSSFISGMSVNAAKATILDALEKENIGERTINYRLRDAGFSRQRYWGEPFPIVYKNDTPYTIEEAALNLSEADQQLPVLLPHVDHYGHGPDGEGPLANIPSFVTIKNKDGEQLRRETSTMPGYAGSSWYFIRYMNPHNEDIFAGEDVSKYWNQVDLYIGGTEHAVGHLLYSRFWTKVLYDLGYLSFEEPFKQLLNQGMIQGSSRFVFRIANTNTFVSEGLKHQYDTQAIHVDVSLVDGVILNVEQFRKWRSEYENAEFILEDGKYICGAEVEKMSKSKYNVVNPDDIVAQYGADTFRMYEMFLGPIEMSKPWDTKGIEGVHRFLKKFWRLYFDEHKGIIVTDENPSASALKVLHKSIKKIEEDVLKFSFNTTVSQFMIVTNELHDLKCHSRTVLEPLVQLIAPFAPYIAEEIWHQLGHDTSIILEKIPPFDATLLVENSKTYPVSINGKHRTNMEFSLDTPQSEIEDAVLRNEVVQKWTEGKTPKKFIFIKGKMINVVL